MNEQELILQNNQAQCMVEKEYWGYTNHINICTGKEVNVSWTPAEYGVTVFMAVVLIFLVSVLVAMLKKWEDW